MNNTNSADVNIISNEPNVRNVDIQNDVRMRNNCVDSPVFLKPCEDTDPYSLQDADEPTRELHELLPPNKESEWDHKHDDFRAKIASKINFSSNIPHIAIKMKDNYIPQDNEKQVVLLNGIWDTTSEIPNIVAEMHNVNLEELQVLKSLTMSTSQESVGCSGTGMGGKQMKLDSGIMDMPPTSLSSTTSVFTGSPSPRVSEDSGIEGDSTDGNLSWLLNYKINELPPVPEQPHSLPPAHTIGQSVIQTVTETPKQQQMMPVTANTQYHAVDEHGNMIDLQSNGYTSVPQQYHSTVVHSNPPTAVAKYTGPKKPPFTYTELIEHALVEKGELTVSGIYQWISDHFPFYKQNDDRWKNSVRHNLSINPHFRKGSKAVHGAGHLWTIAQKEEHKSWQIKRQKLQQFIKSSAVKCTPESLQDIELENATASILPPEPATTVQEKRLEPDSVAIEYVIDMSGGFGDFLCPPASKEQVVEECGFTGDYLITDLHQSTLGLNMGEGEILQTSNLYDDLNFHTFELQGE